MTRSIVQQRFLKSPTRDQINSFKTTGDSRTITIVRKTRKRMAQTRGKN